LVPTVTSERVGLVPTPRSTRELNRMFYGDYY
jgi:hypothetical protein